MTTTPIADRDLCPVPLFGSGARGAYRLFTVFDRRSIEDIVSDVDAAGAAASIVLHFDYVTESRRRELARLSRQGRHRGCLLLDDSLLLHLAAQRGARLKAFFSSASPFTAVDPYVTAAGNVPPEMFFGRERERAEIVARHGSSFIFGGRQLGKTALLRDVERSFGNPSEGRIAKWIDLKAEGLGEHRDIQDLWHVLASVLRDTIDMPRGITQHKTFGKRITEFLEGDSQRRVLLLLDEADAFLAADAERGFQATAQLKNLMEQTDGRFKVVFAGLHNVQRTTRLANHPLAHFGEALCIGPLLRGRDVLDGRALVERPFAAAGYQFESNDLPTRILSQTNYFPSLIQLYCKQLLKHIGDFQTAHFDDKSGPPYVITSRHLDEAYQSRDLRKAIRERFVWTLQLDPRYEVLALLIAYGTMTQSCDEFTVRWIRDEIATCWPAGFPDSSHEALRAVLDEMVGLGVLRHGQDGTYALRSPNVLSLIGSSDSILDELSREHQPVAKYEPASYHAGLRGETRSYSPLTASQASDLVSEPGVSVVCGNEAAQLTLLRPTLEELCEQRGFVLKPIAAMSRTDFKSELAFAAKEKSRGVVCLVEPPAWDELWARDANAYITSLRSKDRVISIVFVAGPTEAWRWVEDVTTGPSALADVRTVTLRPWQMGFVRKWMSEQAFPTTPEVATVLLELSGGWPVLIRKLTERASENPTSWREQLAGSVPDPLPLREYLGDATAARVGVLKDLSDIGEASANDLALVSQAEDTFVHQVLEWAELLAVVDVGAGGIYRLNTAVAASIAKQH